MGITKKKGYKEIHRISCTKNVSHFFVFQERIFLSEYISITANR